MKMYAFYTAADIPNLEYNHRKYCENNKIEYNKLITSSSLAEKYSYILKFLQKNLGKTLFFIDNFSFFKNFNFVPELKNDFFVQKTQEMVLDNFLIIKSTVESIKVIENVLQYINQTVFFNPSLTKLCLLDIFPDNICNQYPYQEKNGKYINICLSRHENAYEIENTLMVNFTHHHQENEGKYFAEVFCAEMFNQKTYHSSQESYECFNAGQKTAFVTMYTPNIQSIGIIAESNLKQFCLKSNITLHIYRDLTESLKQQNVSGAWCKPWLLLNHFDNHEHLAWIDSDILIGKDYCLDLSSEITVYKDPYYKINSGYMIFKTSQKNKDLIQSVIKEFEKINEPLEGVYKHKGGDQPRFIKVIEEFYPNYTPLSAALGNTHPVYPVSISPYSTDTMIHFMGFEAKLRLAMIKGYNSIITKQYEGIV